MERKDPCDCFRVRVAVAAEWWRVSRKEDFARFWAGVTECPVEPLSQALNLGVYLWCLQMGGRKTVMMWPSVLWLQPSQPWDFSNFPERKYQPILPILWEFRNSGEVLKASLLHFLLPRIYQDLCPSPWVMYYQSPGDMMEYMSGWAHGWYTGWI